jgi:hypothetical protein
MNLPGQRVRIVHTPFIRLPGAENVVAGTSKQYGDRVRQPGQSQELLITCCKVPPRVLFRKIFKIKIKIYVPGVYDPGGSVAKNDGPDGQFRVKYEGPASWPGLFGFAY